MVCGDSAQTLDVQEERIASFAIAFWCVGFAFGEMRRKDEKTRRSSSRTGR